MNQPTITDLDRDKIVAQIVRLPKLAKEKAWHFEYDADADQLVFGLRKMPDDSFLYNVNDEINLFLTPKSEVKGIFIEYFASNYIQHNKELKPVLEVLEEENANIKINGGTAELAKEALEGKLLSQALETLFAQDKITAVYL